MGAVGHGGAVAGVGRVPGLDDGSEDGARLGAGRFLRDRHRAITGRLSAGGSASVWAL